MFAKFDYLDEGEIIAFMESNALIIICVETWLEDLKESDVIKDIATEKGMYAHAVIAKNIITFMIKDTMDYSLGAILKEIFGVYMSDPEFIDNPFK